MELLQHPTPLQLIEHHPGIKHGIHLMMKRDDLIHPEISGNKWRKLKFNIQEARNKNASMLVTAGGPWSNHLAATAAAGNLLGIATIGIVRGEEPKAWSSTLVYCKEKGMKLIFISKHDFNRLPNSISHLLPIGVNAHFIPMGGENDLGVLGCNEILQEIDIDFDLLAISVGTGTTLRGIAGSIPHKRVIGFSALRDSTQHSNDFLEWIKAHQNVELTFDYSLGKFARSSSNLEDFIFEFYEHNKIMLEPVYTGKMMFGLFDLMEQCKIANETTIVAIHTGGLQGLQGFPDLHKRLFTS